MGRFSCKENIIQDIFQIILWLASVDSRTPTEIQNSNRSAALWRTPRYIAAGFMRLGHKFSLEYSTHLERGSTAGCLRRFQDFLGGAPQPSTSAVSAILGAMHHHHHQAAAVAAAGVAVGAATWQHVAICQLCMYKILCNIMAQAQAQTQARRHSWFFVFSDLLRALGGLLVTEG